MDRGKDKMTADDIAAERRAKKRGSQMASGEGLRLQPSSETLLISEDEAYATMLQRHFDSEYMSTPENSRNLNPWSIRVTAPMPMSLAPQTTTTFPTTIPTPPQIVQDQLSMYHPRFSSCAIAICSTDYQ